MKVYKEPFLKKVCIVLCVCNANFEELVLNFG